MDRSTFDACDDDVRRSLQTKAIPMCGLCPANRTTCRLATQRRTTCRPVTPVSTIQACRRIQSFPRYRMAFAHQCFFKDFGLQSCHLTRQRLNASALPSDRRASLPVSLRSRGLHRCRMHQGVQQGCDHDHRCEPVGIEWSRCSSLVLIFRRVAHNALRKIQILPRCRGHMSDLRELQFNNLEAAVDDARQLLATGYVRHGNWSLGQICRHLVLVQDPSVDGYPVWMSLFAPLRPLV